MKRPRNAHLDHKRREGIVVEEQSVPLCEGELARAHQQLLRHLEAGLVQQLRSSLSSDDTVSCAKDGSKAFTVSVDRREGVSLDLSFDLSLPLLLPLSLPLSLDLSLDLSLPLLLDLLLDLSFDLSLDTAVDTTI